MIRIPILNHTVLFTAALTVLVCSCGREDPEPEVRRTPLVESPAEEATAPEAPRPSFGAAAAARRRHPLAVNAIPVIARPLAAVPVGTEQADIASAEAVSDDAEETLPPGQNCIRLMGCCSALGELNTTEELNGALNPIVVSCIQTVAAEDDPACTAGFGVVTTGLETIDGVIVPGRCE